MRTPLWRPFLPLLAAASLGLALPAKAIILFDGDNAANTTNPGGGLPWDAVGKLTNTAGTAVAPSAIYLGNGYMLTANHVTMSGLSSVTFDGTTMYTIDTSYTPQQVAAGVDMKIFKLTTNPSVTAVNILTLPVEQVADATMVGWGVGRDPADAPGSDSVTWGADSTATKRWGINVPKEARIISYSGGYSYEAIVTYLGSEEGDPAGVGAEEGALTINDSGSALFQKIGGTWFLIGVAATVDTNGTSIFGDDDGTVPAGNGDANYFVRVSSYDAQINAIISVPEPGGLALPGLGAAAVILTAAARRRIRG